MVTLLASLLITAIPLVAGLHKIRPNVRQLQSNDEAAIIVDYHNKGLEHADAMAEDFTYDYNFPNALEVLLEFLEEDGGLPPFSSEEMSALATDVFAPDADGEVDAIGALLSATEGASSPVVMALHESLSEDEYGSLKEFTDKVDDAAQTSGQESEILLASLAISIAETSYAFWNDLKPNARLSVRLEVVISGAVGTIVGYLLGGNSGYLNGGLIGAILLGIMAPILVDHNLFDEFDDVLFFPPHNDGPKDDGTDPYPYC